ncbi:MAG: thioredoxin family protein [Acidimicrobiia bacterium]|nr:MAG: thioredoxin family protein [Acidimicrobiia bacterium]
MTVPPSIVDRATWLQARRELLSQEKELTRLRDELSQKRRTMPWVRIDKIYTFDTPDGARTLADLFEGRSQLLIYHFMMGPDWTEGCPTCSFWADNFDGIDVHLADRDTTFVAISRAPLTSIVAYKTRMGWSFPWISSGTSNFNMDFNVSFPTGDREGANYNFAPFDGDGEERPGVSVFSRNVAGEIFHSYSAYARGIEAFNGAYQLLDLTPKGRGEDGLRFAQEWIRRHDDYHSPT